MTELIWSHLALGPLLLLVSIWFVIFPPREINRLYGYRTPRSMASQEAWNFANHLGARWFIWASTATILCQVASIFLFTPLVSLTVSIGVMITLLILIVVAMESKLKRQFP